LSGLVDNDEFHDFTSRAFAVWTASQGIRHVFANKISPSHIAHVERSIRKEELGARGHGLILNSMPGSLRSVASRIRRHDRTVTATAGFLKACTILNNTPRPDLDGLSPNDVTTETYERVALARERARVAEVDKYLAMGGSHLPFLPRIELGTIVRRRLSPISLLDTPGLRNHFSKESSRQTYSSALYRVVGFRRTSPVISYILAAGLDSAPLPESYTINQLIVVSPPSPPSPQA
jgi:hypothetical protein